MRIIILTLILVLPYFYFRSNDDASGPQIDAIKLKLGAPERSPKKSDRILTAKEIIQPSVEESPVYEESEEELEPVPARESLAGSSIGDLEQVQVEEIPDLEENWNIELKSMLTRLEPVDGEQIFKSWQTEQESYQAEMDALLNEKQQQKDGFEVDHMIEQLEEKHQMKLKDLLGAHYEAVRDHYEDFMETSQFDTP